MDGINIEFSAQDGLVFSKSSAEIKTVVHQVKIETLEGMSLADLDYCISTNVFLELTDLHDFFREYLWSEDGELSPQKARDEPR